MFSYQIDDQVALALPRPENDSQPLFELIDHSRKNLATWLPWVPKIQTAADEKNFLQMVLLHFAQEKSLNTVIYYQSQPAGMISFNHFRQLDQSADIGYWLGDRFTGQNIMHRAVCGICQLGFSDYQLNKIVINAAVENTRSNQVAQNTSFKLDGVLRANELLLDGRFHDENHWSLLQSEWQK